MTGLFLFLVFTKLPVFFVFGLDKTTGLFLFLVLTKLPVFSVFGLDKTTFPPE